MEKHVTSLELSKKLKEQGFPQVTKFTWSNWYSGELVFGKGNENFQGDYHVVSTPCWNDEAIQYAAYLPTELGEWLPVDLEIENDKYYCSIIEKTLRGYYVEIAQPRRIFYFHENESLPNSLARKLSYLAEQEIIDPKKLKPLSNKKTYES